MPDNNFVNICLISGNINYFNRIIKKYDTLAEYQALGSYYITTVNFDPGNNLQTTLVIGTSLTNALTIDCNYLIVYTTANNTDTIQQRWWVMDQKRTRGGQYTLSLKRDVIADFYDIVTEAPCFIEKATIRDFNNPLIFNKEDMDFNQIKKSEIPLQDETKMAWIVGYVDRSYNGGTITSVYDVRTDYTDVTIPFSEGTYKSVNNVKLNLFYGDFDIAAMPVSKSYIQFDDSTFANYQSFYKEVTTRIPAEEPKLVYDAKWTISIPQTIITPTGYLEEVGNYIKTNKSAISSAFNTTYGYTSVGDMQTIANLAGKTYYDSNERKYYKIRVSLTGSNKTINVLSSSAFGVAINNGIRIPVTNEKLYLNENYSSVGGYTTIDCWEKTLVVSFEEYQPEAASISISSSRNRLNDAPYDMFAIPYPLKPTSVITSYTDYMNFTYFDINKEDSLHYAETIGAQLGAHLYDIQILPYCPITNIMGNFEIASNIYEDLLHTISLTANKDYTIITTTGENPENVGIIFWATSSGRTFNIDQKIIVENPKIDNETKMYRLVSPNYAGMFEFSPAKNGGVDNFNVDITYKPYNPYIHVNPNFKFMYGSDFNDNRGLICGGDYSVAIVDDKWANFEINNKNYQLIFDREVQHMDFTRGQERVGQIAGAVVGTAQGALQGAMSGAGVAGAIAGGLTSAAGGAVDIVMSEQKYKEELSLKKDLYGYNLGNTKALPASLTKSMSLNENFKFWPFLEEYECSDIEKEAFELKLRYDGMTIMKIGKISDYLALYDETFIKGQIIRLENLSEASDVAYEIFNEIKRGVYI